MKKEKLDYVYVGIQLLLFVAYVFPAFHFGFGVISPLPYLGGVFVLVGAICMILAFIQLNTTLSPFPTPKENNVLITDGIFSLMRHPIYTGILLFFGGYALVQGSTYKATITLFLWILFYYKSSYEETKLIARYTEVYLDYRKKTGRFFPKFRIQ